jgi:ABC-type uncharacterized transport system permease subunit
MITAQWLFKIAAGLYAAALIIDISFNRRRSPSLVFLLPALAANAAALLFRYLPAWPMMPMYLGPLALALVLGIFSLTTDDKRSGGAMARRILLGFSVLVSLLAVFFPKDFYLPFLKSQTLWSHLFLLLATAGKGCFLAAAARALAILIPQNKTREDKHAATAKNLHGPATRPADRHTNSPFLLTVWGFALFTLSMFAGELWSYRGWGSPVAWEDPAITTIMATWFFYIGLLHLHLTGAWSPKSRNICTAAGAGIIIVFNVLPDLGPFRGVL